ncbi:MAG: 16S rRNA (cytosine(1402)-N(4))-methyltransferase RsmH [Thermodesulfobacteriota bacterium]
MHVPVLLNEMLQLLKPRAGGIYLDGTLGAGGYSEAILTVSNPDSRVVALDLDTSAVERARVRLAAFGERFRAIQRGFQDAREILRSLGIDRIDGAVLDLGLSSDQLEAAERGFSFLRSGPLDMRFDPEAPEGLADLLDRVTEEELARMITMYGEEKRSRRIARAVLSAQRGGELKSTEDLARVIAKSVGFGSGKIHPATRTFQALRIAVNRELENLERALEEIPTLLSPGGRFCVVSYHSLEDRRVKHSFRDRVSSGRSKWALITKKAIKSSKEEIRANPRARSARLRVLEAIG